MIFYEIDLLNVPELRFACSVDLEKHSNHFDRVTNFLEICIHEEGSMIAQYPDGRKELVPPRVISCVTQDAVKKIWTVEGERQRHTTVGVTVPYRCRRYESEKECDLAALRERVLKNGTILLPQWEELGESYGEFLQAEKKVIACHTSQLPGDRTRAIGQWYQLAARLTEFTWKKLAGLQSDVPPSEQWYLEKALRYIHANYREKLTVGEIAAQVGISEGYLHRIFQRGKGMGVLEYRNRHRVEMAMELMEHRRVSLKEAAWNVGVEDEAYMSRLFRRVTGRSYRQYCKEKQERG